MIGIAEGMQALVTLVGRPVVVHEHAEELRQQAACFQGFSTAFGVGQVGRQPCGAELELWLSLAKRASSSSMRSRSWLMVAACATTSARSPSSSLLDSAKELLVARISDMTRDYAPSSLLGRVLNSNDLR
jgi:hypothetical protein